MRRFNLQQHLQCRQWHNIMQASWRWKSRPEISLFWYFMHTLYHTFAGILYPPSSESSFWYLAVHGIITAHLIVSISHYVNIWNAKINTLRPKCTWNLIRKGISNLNWLSKSNVLGTAGFSVDQFHCVNA